MDGFLKFAMDSQYIYAEKFLKIMDGKIMLLPNFHLQ